MSEKKNTPAMAPRRIRYPQVNPDCLCCRFCAQEPPAVQLIRIHDTELGEVLNELCPPGMFGLLESELSEWCCLECKRVLEKTHAVASRVSAARRTILQYTNDGISLSTAIARDSELAASTSSRKRTRTTEQVEINQRTTVMVGPVKSEPVGPLLEDSPTTRLRERQEALRSRMKSREDPEREMNPTVVRTIRALFSPPAAAVNPGEEAPPNQLPPVHQVVCVDELEIVFSGELADKRVPDILTPPPSEEDEPPRTPSPCSSGSIASEADLAMLLKDPSQQCDYCSLMFLTQQQLGWHLRTHTGRSSIRCRLCPRVLPKVSSFLQHQTQEHPLLRRTYCILCNEYFRSECRAKHDQHHMRTRMKYACSFCPLIFYNHKQQKHHRQLFHNDWKLMCRMAPTTEQN